MSCIIQPVPNMFFPHVLLGNGWETRNHKTTFVRSSAVCTKIFNEYAVKTNKRNSNTILLVYISVHKVDAQTILAHNVHTPSFRWAYTVWVN